MSLHNAADSLQTELNKFQHELARFRERLDLATKHDLELAKSEIIKAFVTGASPEQLKQLASDLKSHSEALAAVAAANQTKVSGEPGKTTGPS